MKIRLVLCALLAALVVPAGSLATTLPTKTVYVTVLITDQKIIFATYQNAISGNGTPENLLFVGTIPRGEYLRFTVLNRGAKVHDFKILGSTTKPIKPGGKVKFNKLAKTRGTFPWESTLDKGAHFRGKIVVA